MALITPKARLSFPNLFTPKAGMNGGDEKYSACLVFAPGTDLSELEAAALNVAKEKWADKAEGLLRTGRLRWPFRTDVEEKGYEPGSVFINVNSKNQPGVVGRYAGPDGKPVAIEDPLEVYAGCYVRASVKAFAYDTSGNRGISFGLNNIQKLDDGPRLDGRKRAEDEFDATETEPASIGVGGLLD